MNRRPSGLLHFDMAVEGFLQFKLAEGIGQRTYHSYKYDLSIFITQMANPIVKDVDSMILTRFISWLRVDYKPQRKNGDDRLLAL